MAGVRSGSRGAEALRARRSSYVYFYVYFYGYGYDYGYGPRRRGGDKALKGGGAAGLASSIWLPHGARPRGPYWAQMEPRAFDAPPTPL